MMFVMPTENHSNYVQWSKLDVPGKLFNLYRSTSPESGFEPLFVNKNSGFYLDENVNLLEEGKWYYYKLEVLNENKTIVETIGPVKIEHGVMNGMARAIIREYGVVLRVMGNPLYKLLLKKRSGVNCDECYNPVTKTVMYPSCEKCNGTGIVRGYHEPIDIYMSKDISQEMEYTSMLDSEKVKLTNVNAWMLPYPRVSPGDVIVDKLNRRYRVTNVSPRTHSSVLLRQVLQLVPLEKGSPAYQVEVFKR